MTLEYIEPLIWRRIILPLTFTLEDLHDVIQFGMGWEDCHLHAFRIKGKSYSMINVGLDDIGMEDEAQVELSQVALRARSRFLYEYDFGDSWIHGILVEKLLADDHLPDYPVCTDGARACPPEDCGGPYGYEAILRALKAPQKSAEQAEFLEWVGDYDPEAFNLEQVNKMLKKI
ncbi:plasmid pRiA4b ORF-3 family protein [Kamptonema cortianum]|nr:plasmid pRiA4b ORF-3 family protein [Kamptonema cortianum]